MANRVDISQKVKQKLWMLSGNECALPTCKNPIFDISSNTYIAEIAHIEAYSKGGPRFNEALNTDSINGFENLILVCGNCHKIIDSNESDFSVEQLKQFKETQITKNKPDLKLELTEISQIIKRLETNILETFSFLENTTKIDKVDSPEMWLKTFLNIETPHTYLERIGLPYAEKLVPAFAIIIESNSPYSTPIIRYLCNRISIYFSVVDEVCALYPITDSQFRNSIIKWHKKLMDLLKPYESSVPKSVERIADALKKQELYPFRDVWNSTDLRVVLKTLHEDNKKSSHRETLLDFVFQQLQIEIQNHSTHHIPEPRHAWWSIETLLTEKEREWVINNLSVFNSAIKEFLNREFEENNKVKKSAVASELHTKEMEDLWATVNMIKILNLSNSKNIPIEINIYKKVENLVKHIVENIKKDSNGNKFIIFCIKLVLLQEYKKYLENI